MGTESSTKCRRKYTCRFGSMPPEVAQIRWAVQCALRTLFGYRVAPASPLAFPAAGRNKETRTNTRTSDRHPPFHLVTIIESMMTLPLCLGPASVLDPLHIGGRYPANRLHLIELRGVRVELNGLMKGSHGPVILAKLVSGHSQQDVTLNQPGIQSHRIGKRALRIVAYNLSRLKEIQLSTLACLGARLDSTIRRLQCHRVSSLRQHPKIHRWSSKWKCGIKGDLCAGRPKILPCNPISASRGRAPSKSARFPAGEQDH